jgi:hypothetical protein
VELGLGGVAEAAMVSFQRDKLLVFRILKKTQ